MTEPDVIKISDDLTIAIGGSKVRLSPSQGLSFSEELARKSFRRALTEEAVALRDEEDGR